MEKQIFSDFIDKYRDAEMVVIGIGEEWNAYLEKVREKSKEMTH